MRIRYAIQAFIEDGFRVAKIAPVQGNESCAATDEPDEDEKKVNIEWQGEGAVDHTDGTDPEQEANEFTPLDEAPSDVDPAAYRPFGHPRSHVHY
jgi:hypothetical protein